MGQFQAELIASLHWALLPLHTDTLSLKNPHIVKLVVIVLIVWPTDLIVSLVKIQRTEHVLLFPNLLLYTRYRVHLCHILTVRKEEEK